MPTTIFTNPESSLAISDGNAGDAFSLTNGPPENGFQTSEFVDPAGTTIFANQTNFIVNGGGTKHAVTLDNPNPAAGLELVTFESLGAGSDVEGGSSSGADITVETLDLAFSAAGDIGDTRALRTQVTNLGVSGAGNVRITNGVVTPTTLNASVTATGFVNLTNNGTINAIQSGISGNQGVNITTNGSTADLNTGSGADISSSGTVDLIVGEDINLGDAVGPGSVAAATGVILSAGRNLTLNANAIIVNTGSGNISINAGMAGAGGNITMLTSPGNPGTAPEIVNNASGGSITLQAGPGGTLTLNSTGATAVKTTNGGNGSNTILLAADAMAISAAINSGTATTTLAPVTAGQAITLGGANAPGVLGLTQAELNEITAGTLRIGNIATGNITINATISNPPGDQIVSLINNGTITESPFGALSIPNLRISSTGPVTLGSANNVIATLAASVTNRLTVNDNTHILTVGTVDGVSGITTNNSAINLTADAMNLGQQVFAGSGIVTLSTFSAAQQITLGGTAGNSSGVLGLSDAELGEITASTLRINAVGGIITSSGTINSHAGYNTLSLATNSPIALANNISVTNLALNAGVGIGLAGTNTISTLAFYNANTNNTFTTVAISDSTALTIGSVDGIASSANLGGTTAITVTGAGNNLTFATGLYSVGAATLTSSGGSFIDKGNGAFVDVTAPSLALAAQTGVGTSATPLQMQVRTLSATTATGGIFINNDSVVPGTLNIGANSVGLTVTGASGDIFLTNNGTINSTVAGDNITGPGNITIKAQGANSDINLSGQTALFSVFINQNPDTVDIEAGRDLNLGGSTANSEGAVSAGGGSAILKAGRNLTINPNAEVVGGSITATAGGNFTMTTSPGSLGDEFVSGGGAIALSAGAGATMTLTSSGATAVSSSGGNITLTADFLNIGKAINATTAGNVLIRPVTAGQLISLGTASGGLQLTNTELDEITAKTITVGNASAGEVSLAGTIAPMPNTNLTIDTGSGVLASGASIALGTGVLTIGFDESGAGATADLRSLTSSASAVDVIGGPGDDTFLPSTSTNMTMTGGGGADTFEGTGQALDHDTITDLYSGDKIVITDANIANFSYQLNGTTLTFGGDTLTLSNAPTGHFMVSADPVAGVDLTYYAPPPADFNGDGISDVLLLNADGSVVDWTMNGSQITAAQTLTFQGNPVTLAPSYTNVGTGDFNGDGKADVLLRSTSGNFVDWTMNGSQIATAQMLTYLGNVVSLDSSWSVAGTGDFNGDSKADILLRNTGGSLVDWTMNGSQITAAQLLTYQGSPVTLASSWSIAGVGDFDGDSKADILLRGTNGNLIEWTMNGSQITAAQFLTYQGNAVTLDPTWSIVGVGDFNGDGEADILLRNTSGNFVDWTMNGTQIVSAQYLTFQGNPINLDASWSVVEVGDLNGDGKADILLRNTNGSFADWTMNGSQIATAQLLTFQGNPLSLDGSWQTEVNPTTGGPGAQIVSSGNTINNPTIANGTLDLMSGAIVNGPIIFVAGGTGTLLDADQASLPDTVMGFTEGADYLKFSGESASSIASVVASQQLVNSNTVLTFPDSTSIVLAGITHVDAGFFA